MTKLLKSESTMKNIAILLKLMMALGLLTWVLNSAAFLPVMYSKAISIRFDEGKFDLSTDEKARLIKLIEHKDDFLSLNTFLVIAHGDEESSEANREAQAMLAGARANSVNTFYAEHAPLEFHELIHTFTEPITHKNVMKEAGRVTVLIQGFCKPGNDSVCKEHWPPSPTIERE
ncbi:hypothetical protein WI58_38085 [Burkholderia cepacia]|uniref:hypothetical protein n=1 Tax=Burkholderia cepacia TaxID=292 RepID=UPI000758A432|nr:hypothetical protein [Burkholderia cepacia]KVA49880.1 hypothetical protein WI48_27845 [Burkholderia cepacia]KVA57277.1 hypothetical protein WI49_30090 [Burkholderia cepacia]KVA76924.1 hypothetical protein WI50_35990 [Burkholderia cepacia]KVA95154.1 hypothetical protein WI52_36555 [Burkholderia cepacia]KVA97553.1 hypothetical protein WI51_32815 [Burkholderia cepacia]